MKRLTILVILVACLSAFAAEQATNYEEVAFSQLMISLEKYKSKYVSYSAAYRKLATDTFPPYMVAAGFKSSKYLHLVIGDARLPVIARKTDAMATNVTALRIGSTVKVQGRVKEFKPNPRRPFAPRYYVELKDIELIYEPPAAKPRAQPKP